ncbi:MAG: OsmC family protein [Burkholderiaceae bacterium]|nr:OsmC family protein [Burkholderiaceae bacterium]
MSNPSQTVRLTQVRDYQFDADFGGQRPPVRIDEPAPLGQGVGPSPVQLLSSAVGSCLSASLLFALRKFKQQPDPINCEVQAEVGRGAGNRLRVLSMSANLTLGVPADTLEHLDRVLATFEDYCTVTQSVSQGFPVTVSIFDIHGTRLK